VALAEPMKEKLHGSDYRFILTCLVLFAAATWYSTHNFYRAFPEASIDFHVNRDGGRSLAERFLAAQNYNLAGYRHASRFDFDDSAKTFIEREAGLEQANRLMGSRISPVALGIPLVPAAAQGGISRRRHGHRRDRRLRARAAGGCRAFRRYHCGGPDAGGRLPPHPDASRSRRPRIRRG